MLYEQSDHRPNEDWLDRHFPFGAALAFTLMLGWLMFKVIGWTEVICAWVPCTLMLGYYWGSKFGKTWNDLPRLIAGMILGMVLSIGIMPTVGLLGSSAIFLWLAKVAGLAMWPFLYRFGCACARIGLKIRNYFGASDVPQFMD